LAFQGGKKSVYSSVGLMRFLLFLAGAADAGEFDMMAKNEIGRGVSRLGHKLFDNRHVDVIHLAAGRATNMVMFVSTLI